MRDYRKLEAFQRSHELVKAVYQLTGTFPTDERFGLTSQLRRAAVSIASNIVEGSARSSETEYCRFLEIAHSSSWEVGYQLTLAEELGCCAKEGEYIKRAKELADHASRLLGRLIQAIGKERT